MKWFNKWLSKKLKQAWDESSNTNHGVAMAVSGAYKSRESKGLNTEGIRMTLHKANGGYAIEFENYDTSTDRMLRELHVFADDTNLGESIAQAVTYHLLKST